MPLEATAIVTLAETKTHLNIDPADSAYDAELELFINAATVAVEDIVGPVVTRAVTETVAGGGVFHLSQTPVVALTSVTGVYGTTTVYTVADLYVDKKSGAVRPAYGAGSFVPLYIEVIYTAGRGATAPAAIKLATLIVIEHLWETQRGAGTPASLLAGGDDDSEAGASFGFGFAVPNRAKELLRPYLKEQAPAVIA